MGRDLGEAARYIERKEGITPIVQAGINSILCLGIEALARRGEMPRQENIALGFCKAYNSRQ